MSLSTGFREEVRDRILYQLANEPLNSRELEARLGYSYTTIRRALQELMDTGSISRFDKSARNTRYIINKSHNETVTLVPTIQFKGQVIKLTNLYLDQGMEEIGTNAIDSLLKSWTTIATTARRLSEGMPSNVLIGKLKRQKVELANARSNLEHLVYLINQLLDNHKLWEAEHLINFPDDPDWETFLPFLEELYTHYYGGPE